MTFDELARLVDKIKDKYTKIHQLIISAMRKVMSEECKNNIEDNSNTTITDFIGDL